MDTIYKRVATLEALIKKLLCSLTGDGSGQPTIEQDPTVPLHVKDITQEEVDNLRKKEGGVWKFN